MSALADFVLDRLAEDEVVAQSAPGNVWTAHTEDSIAGASVYDEQWVLLYPMHYFHDEPLSNRPGATGPAYIEESRDQLCAHIARHDPASALMDIRVKRNIVEWLNDTEQALDDDPNDDHMQGQFATLDFVVRSFAWLYRNHPEYREEFKTGGLDPA